MKNIATVDCVLSVEPDIGSPGVGGTATVSSGQSSKVRASGFVLKDGASVTVVGVTAPGGYVQPAPIVGSLVATTTKVRVEGSLAVVEGDQSKVNVPLVQVPSGTPMNVAMVVRVVSAGQTDVRAN